MRRIEALNIAIAAAAAAAQVARDFGAPKRSDTVVTATAPADGARAWWRIGKGKVDREAMLAHLFDLAGRRLYGAEILYRTMAAASAVEPDWPAAPEPVKRAFHVFAILAQRLHRQIVDDPEPAPAPRKPANPRRGVEKTDEDDSLKGRVSGSAARRAAARERAATPAAPAASGE